jgi:hypothetical protein
MTAVPANGEYRHRVKQRGCVPLRYRGASSGRKTWLPIMLPKSGQLRQHLRLIDSPTQYAIKLIDEQTVRFVLPAMFDGIICQPIKVGMMNVTAIRYMPHFVHLYETSVGKRAMESSPTNGGIHAAIMIQNRIPVQRRVENMIRANKETLSTPRGMP